MKNRDIFACSLDSLFTKKWTNIAIMICMTITLVLVYFSAVMYYNTKFYENRIRRTIRDDTEYLVNVTVESGNLTDEAFLTKIDAYIDALKELNGISYSGAYFVSQCTFEELFYNETYAEINRSCTDELALINYPRHSLVLYTDYELFSMYDISYNSEAYAQAIEEGYIPVVVGSAYKDFLSVGDTLKFREDTYKVIEIMDKSYRWVSETYGIAVSEYNTINLDYFFIIPREYAILQSAYLHSIYFRVDDRYSVKTVSSLAVAEALDKELHISVKTVADSFDEIKENEDEEIKYTFYMYISMIMVCIVSASTANIVSVLFRKTELGIYIANGVSIREIFKMIMLETILKVFLSCAAAIGIGYYTYKDMVSSVNREVLIDGMGIVFCLCLVILVISDIFPVCYLWRKKPREFLEECL